MVASLVDSVVLIVFRLLGAGVVRLTAVLVRHIMVTVVSGVELLKVYM